jgi:hypothetical protein
MSDYDDDYFDYRGRRLVRRNRLDGNRLEQVRLTRIYWTIISQNFPKMETVIDEF